MDAVATALDPTSPSLPPRSRPPLRRAAKVAVWIAGVPALLLVLLYLVLLLTPVRLPFGSGAVRALVMANLPPTSNLQLGEMALALERGVWPVVRFDPVVLTDSKSGAHVEMAALEIGFSPVRALFGQPGATVTLVQPHIQMVQDLLGPRMTSFELVPDPKGGAGTVRVLEGQDAYPAVDISTKGIAVTGPVPATVGAMRSDNDWLIFNMEGAEQGIADIVEQATQGRFSRLVIRDGTVEMTDAVYGLFRRFEHIELSIGPAADRKNTEGAFSATLGGRTMEGTVARNVDDSGATRLEADVTNIDFAAFMPFIDDPASMMAVRGAGALSIDVNFAAGTGALQGGVFKVDLTGLDLRIKSNYFPIASSILDIAWDPKRASFTLADTAVHIGESSARLSGIFAMGLDKAFGPTIGISLRATDLAIVPPDMEAPAEPFEDVQFSGWSAPLYGALGIDRLLATKGAAKIEAAGRVDMLQAGLGFALTVTGESVTADDLKRLWPSLTGGEARKWVVDNVTAGVVSKATLKFDFPVGTLGLEGENKPIPRGAMSIDMVGSGVSAKPTPAMAPIALAGDTTLQVRDSIATIAADGGQLDTAAGPVRMTHAALVMDNSNPGETVIEVSGDVSGTIPSILALAKAQQPETVANLKLPLEIEALTGSVDVGMVATVKLAGAAAQVPAQIDYVLNGTVKDFASSKPIQDRRINDGQFAFSVNQSGYQVGGTASIDGIKADVSIEGSGAADPVFKLASDIDTKDLAAMGFDVSDFLTGKVHFVAQPMPDGSIQLAVDLKDAALTIKDLAITKASGVDGILRAVIKQSSELTDLTDVDLTFGMVHLAGSVQYDAKKGLQAANFGTFTLSDGDSAQVALAPISGGYALTVRGKQLDLRPLLQRFFGLGEGSGGVQATQFKQTIALDIKLDRVLGSYATTAFNLTADMLLKGSELRRATLAAQFGDNNGISITTNPTPDGRTMSVAFNAAGTILRFLGVYSQLAGGQGNLVLNSFTDQKLEAGQLNISNFAIVDEANVAEILGNHADSRSLIAKQNRLDFDSGEVKFIRRADRVEITEAILTGQSVGGTGRGFIYTDKRQYDLTGTYVPLFGLNSAFQKIPLLGPLLGGRDGEGLVGVTFAVTGRLDKPSFRINPLSALVPGAFRELFEFRAKEQPRAE